MVSAIKSNNGMSEQQENWSAVPGYSSYEVSDLGRVRRVSSCNRTPAGYILKCYPAPEYLRVSLFEDKKRKDFHVHVLVMLAFKGPPPPGTEVLHADGKKDNCALSNLSYGTRRQNKRDGYKLGEISSRVTETQVLEIRHLRSEGGTLKDIAKRFNISIATVSNIVRRKTWRHL